MTTKVTIDAHAGWPVQVVVLDRNKHGIYIETATYIVEPNTVQDFYVHNDRRFYITEMTKDDTAGASRET